jgi:hypothetical protein
LSAVPNRLQGLQLFTKFEDLFLLSQGSGTNFVRPMFRLGESHRRLDVESRADAHTPIKEETCRHDPRDTY